MIPGELQQISWDDIQRLIETSREEDDTIEFKQAFKGGDDYLALNDRSRELALDTLAREVLAFLNTRGGDLLIGVQEAEDGPPIATKITGIKNAQETADRVARGLAAIIEPAQTNLAVRAFSDAADEAKGVLLIRVQPSIRAPHRSKRTRECYSRRGSESVPMAMDEIQDVTINRTRLRLEQSQLLDQQFTDFAEGRSDHQVLPGAFVHIRTVVQPLLEQTISIDDQLLASMGHARPIYYSATGSENLNDVAFRQLEHGWKPILRGQKREFFYQDSKPGNTDFMYACKRIKESGIVSFAFAASSHFDDRPLPTVHFEWFVGYFAEIYRNIVNASALRPTLLPATLRVAIHVAGQVNLSWGTGMWSESKQFPSGFHNIPNFIIENEESLFDFFERIQVDIFSLTGTRLNHPFSLMPPSAE